MNKNLVLYGVFLHTFFPSVINHVKLQIAGWVDENKCILIVYSNAVQLRIRKNLTPYFCCLTFGQSEINTKFTFLMDYHLLKKNKCLTQPYQEWPAYHKLSQSAFQTHLAQLKI